LTPVSNGAYCFVMARPTHRLLLSIALLFAAGCSSGPPPESAAPPPVTPPRTDPETGFTKIVSGAQDSMGRESGSPNALYRYRFRQTDPGSSTFTFQDRDLSFYFRPTPDALHMQIENRQERPVWIDWDRSTFIDPIGNSGKVAHGSTRWDDRFRAQSPTQIAGLQRYGDYLLPLEYLVDPAGRDEQLHRPLFPEDQSAPQYSDRAFGVDLVIRIEDRTVTYPFRFRVSSVLPR
jgi:hypothetical protein